MCDNLRLVEMGVVSTEHPLVKFVTAEQHHNIPRACISDIGILGVYFLKKYQEHDLVLYTTYSTYSVAKRLMLFDWRLAA